MSIDPDFKRRQFLALKEAADNGRIIPEKRRRFTAKERQQVHADYEGRCRACDRLVGLSYQIDHRIPLFRGGKHERANWELLCVPCHAEKTGEEASGNAAIRRIEDRILNGPRPATLKGRSDWPKGKQKIPARVNPWGYRAKAAGQ